MILELEQQTHDPVLSASPSETQEEDDLITGLRPRKKKNEKTAAEIEIEKEEFNQLKQQRAHKGSKKVNTVASSRIHFF